MKTLNNRRQLKIGVVLSYISIVINILAGLLYTPWMISHIGQSQYGLFTLANSLIGLFLIDFGLSSATARYVSKYHAEGDEEKVNGFLGVIYKLYLFIDALIFIALLVVYFLIDTIYVRLTSAEIQQFRTVYLIVALFSIINFPFITLNGILTAYEKFVPMKLADILYRLLVVGSMIIVLNKGYGLYALVTINAVAGLLVIAYKLLVINKKVPVKANFRYSDNKLYKDIFGFSVWTTVSSLAQRLIFSITPTILGIVTGNAAIAVFGIVSTIEGYVFTITSAINGMFMPRISRIYAIDEAEQNLSALLLRVGKFQFALNGIVIVGFAVLGETFINLWIGHDYIDAYYGILLVIIPGLFLNSLQIANTAMVVTKRVDMQAYVDLTTGLINVALSFYLSKQFGVIGASISIFFAYLLRAFAINIICYKVMKFDIPRFVRECYLRMSIPIILVLLCGFLLNHFIMNGAWEILVVKGCILICVYLFAVLYTGINKDERDAVFSQIHKVIRRISL